MLTTRQLFLQHVAQTSPAPLCLEIERAEGIYLIDIHGKKYMDLISGIGVSNVGHSHPKIIAAIRSQAEKYMHLMVYGEYIQSPQVLLAEALVDILPTSLNSVYFTNSGAEATEGAMKLAKRFTGRTQFVNFKNAYHGSTQGALSVLGDENFKQNFRPLLPDILTLEYGNILDLDRLSTLTAAVIIDPIQAESGVTIPSKEYLQKLRKVCTELGVLLILDEAQTAFGRTGKLFCLEHFDIVPDILLLAKAFGGGMPLGAFISDKKIMNCFTENPVLGHITTFGGHAVSCAAGLASLHILQEENLLENVEKKGLLFEQLLNHKKIKSIRRIGLMMALKFADFEENKKIIDQCIERGVITDWFLFAPNCLRICPPLTISETEIKQACEVILSCIEN